MSEPPARVASAVSEDEKCRVPSAIIHSTLEIEGESIGSIMRRKSIAVALVGALVLAACADASTDQTVADATGDTSVATTGSDGTESAGGLEAIAELEDDIDELSNAISESEPGQDLSSAWDTLKTELAAAIASFRDEGAVAREEIDSALDAFQQELDELDVDESVSSAWDELRSHVEQLTAS